MTVARPTAIKAPAAAPTAAVAHGERVQWSGAGSGATYHPWSRITSTATREATTATIAPAATQATPAEIECVPTELSSRKLLIGRTRVYLKCLRIMFARYSERRSSGFVELQCHFRRGSNTYFRWLGS